MEFDQNLCNSDSRRITVNDVLSEYSCRYPRNVCDRGKYSLSEREFLWTKRLKGTINVQKVISK